MNKTFREKLIEALENSKLIKKENIEKALYIQKTRGGTLGKILIEEGYIDQKDLLVVFSQQLNIPPINLSKYKINPDVVKLIPEKIAKQYKLIPISMLGETITIAMADPTNIIALDDIKTLTNYSIDLVAASESDVEAALTIYFKKDDIEIDLSKIRVDDDTVESMKVVEEDDNLNISEITAESKTAPVVKVVSMILNEALAKRASDIHIEPMEKNVRVRYRIDGDLQDAITIPKRNQNAIVARLKIMSKLDITENRLPQDGRFKISFRGREVDFRVSMLPVSFGNKIVLRALDRTNLSVGLDNLGILPDQLVDLKNAIARPYGMILITGPTGSGKSTTLYSILNQLNTDERNIVTIEDPVEYQLQGITQIPVNADIGLTFAAGLKSILRQSPDILMVGEIRDSETADIAIKASLTGELVLSTLHTNDAPSAVTRLTDMGVEPFLIASSVILTAAQRLCRKVCNFCKDKFDVPDSVLDRVGFDRKGIPEKERNFVKGRGCARCNNSGYLGRIAVLETFVIDEKIRDMIIKRASSDEIKSYAVSKGMKTLRDNALTVFAKGITSLEEVLRITSEE